jgi:Phosphotransferase enzyme family
LKESRLPFEMQKTTTEEIKIRYKNRFPRCFIDLLLSVAEEIVPCNKASVSNFTSGSDTIIIFISFDGCEEQLVSKSPSRWTTDDPYLVAQLESEVATIKLVESRTKIPVPHVYRHASTISDNALGYPYILMSKAKGIPLDWGGIPVEGREVVMKGLAQHMCQLSRLRFPKLGSIIFSSDDEFTITQPFLRCFPKLDMEFQSIKSYYVFQLDLFKEDTMALKGSSRVPFLRRIPHREDFESHSAFQLATIEYSKGENDWDTEENIALYRALHHRLEDGLKDLVDLESSGSEFVLAHPDLNESNIFIEASTYEITCIIDWERASALPMESFCTVPHLPSTQGPLDDHLRSIFLRAFEDCQEGPGKAEQLGLLRQSEPMWAWEKLVQRASGTYFHYAVDVYLSWKIGDDWRNSFVKSD